MLELNSSPGMVAACNNNKGSELKLLLGKQNNLTSFLYCACVSLFSYKMSGSDAISVFHFGSKYQVRFCISIHQFMLTSLWKLFLR